MSKAVKLSNPAYAVAVGYLMVLIVILLPFNVSQVMDPEVASAMSTKYNLGERLFLVVLMLIPFGLSIYSINCYVVGKCVTWSWINAVIILLWVILFVAGAVFFTVPAKEHFSMTSLYQMWRAGRPARPAK